MGLPLLFIYNAIRVASVAVGVGNSGCSRHWVDNNWISASFRRGVGGKWTRVPGPRSPGVVGLIVPERLTPRWPRSEASLWYTLQNGVYVAAWLCAENILQNFQRLPYFSIFLGECCMGFGGPSADALRSSNFTFYMARHSDLNRLSSPSIYVIYVYIYCQRCPSLSGTRTLRQQVYAP